MSFGTYNSGVIIDTDLDGYGDTLYIWGDNSNGQIGNGTTGSDVLSPTIITPNGQTDWGGNLIDLSLGGYHSGVIIDTDLDESGDTLYMWGDNSSGQIGNGTTGSDVLSPTIITPDGQSDWGGNPVDINLWNENSGITIDTDQDQYADTLYTWGDNRSGQIGNGTAGSSVVFSPDIITPKGQSDWPGNLINLSFGNSHSGITVDTDQDQYADTLYMWGDNSEWQLGDGTTSSKYVPTKITPEGQSSWNENLTNLALGLSHSGMAVDANLDGYADTLYMWGYNFNGQLGNGVAGENYYEKYPIITISSYYDFFLENLDFYNDGRNIELNFTLDDYQNIIN